MQMPSLLSMHTRSMTLGLIMSALTACSNLPTDPTSNWSLDKLRDEAQTEQSAGNTEKAISLYEKLEARTAGTPVAQQAQLEKAYLQYKSGEVAQAQATLNRFIKLHPSSPALDYAYYLKGLSQFNDNLGLFGSWSKQDLSERDQQAAKDSFAAFQDLVERFPTSPYASDARQRMTYTINSLAQHEVHVARYLHSKGAYVAAVNRAQAVITDYQGTPATEEALSLLAKSYAALNMPSLQQDAERVLQHNFPQSQYLATGHATQQNKPWWQVW
jgi:outer membrane protein assembly factor BamD